MKSRQTKIETLVKKAKQELADRRRHPVDRFKHLGEAECAIREAMNLLLFEVKELNEAKL